MRGRADARRSKHQDSRPAERPSLANPTLDQARSHQGRWIERPDSAVGVTIVLPRRGGPSWRASARPGRISSSRCRTWRGSGRPSRFWRLLMENDARSALKRVPWGKLTAVFVDCARWWRGCSDSWRACSFARASVDFCGSRAIRPGAGKSRSRARGALSWARANAANIARAPTIDDGDRAVPATWTRRPEPRQNQPRVQANRQCSQRDAEPVGHGVLELRAAPGEFELVVGPWPVRLYAGAHAMVAKRSLADQPIGGFDRLQPFRRGSTYLTLVSLPDGERSGRGLNPEDGIGIHERVQIRGRLRMTAFSRKPTHTSCQPCGQRLSRYLTGPHSERSDARHDCNQALSHIRSCNAPFLGIGDGWRAAAFARMSLGRHRF